MSFAYDLATQRDGPVEGSWLFQIGSVFMRWLTELSLFNPLIGMS